MNNAKIEEFLNGFKIGELLHRNEVSKEKEKNCKLCTALTITLIIILIGAIAFAVYKLTKKEPLEEFEYDFDDDFDDTFSIIDYDESAVSEDEEETDTEE